VAQADFGTQRVAVAGVADHLTSDSYSMSVTSVPIGGVTGVCPSGSVSALGFWSILGPNKVPVRLMMQKNAIDATNVDLSWTGQSSSFAIYRSTSPIDLVSPANLSRTTGFCDDTDENASESQILFFKVIVPPTDGE
jgi:hypothetical protein